MDALGPRLPGTQKHLEFVDMLQESFAESHAQVLRDDTRARAWSATRTELAIRGTDVAVVVPISSPYAHCGSTPAGGSRGRLVHLGGVDQSVDSTDVRGAIVVVDYPFELTPHDHERALWSVVPAPNRDDTSQSVGWGVGSQGWGALERCRRKLDERGAAAMIVAWTNLDNSARNQYQPLLAPSVRQMYRWDTRDTTSSEGLPAVWVGRAAGEKLRACAGSDAHITVETRLDEARPAPSLVATVPGRSERATVLITHTDGVNALQENGGAVLAGLVRLFSGRTMAKTLHVVCTVGHFARELLDECGRESVVAETPGMLQRFPFLAWSAAAAVAVEHLGGTTRPRNDLTAPSVPEVALAYTANPQMAALLTRAFADVAAGPVRIADARPFGLVLPFVDQGTASCSYGSVPLHLNATGLPGPDRLLSHRRFDAEFDALASLVNAIDTEPAFV
jgi:hypothetical protein